MGRVDPDEILYQFHFGVGERLVQLVIANVLCIFLVAGLFAVRWLVMTPERHFRGVLVAGAVLLVAALSVRVLVRVALDLIKGPLTLATTVDSCRHDVQPYRGMYSPRRARYELVAGGRTWSLAEGADYCARLPAGRAIEIAYARASGRVLRVRAR